MPAQTEILVGDLDRAQPVLYLPREFLKQAPLDWSIEFVPRSPYQLQCTLVDPKTSSRYKRYRIVRHNSAAWVSIPRPWLRDVSARPGDRIVMTWATDHVLLTLEKQPR